jgi:omega-6 fatty acid desaturase (delta-12 desaturase)
MHQSDAERAELAKEMGYLQIGREVPDSVTLTDIVRSMPQE